MRFPGEDVKYAMGRESNKRAELVADGAEDLRLFELENGPVISVEINLELIPLFLSKTRDRTEESLEATNVIRTAEGQRLEQYVRVVGGREYGMPGPIDRDVYVAVMKLLHRSGGMPADGRVTFTIYELLEILGKKKGGTGYERVRDCLDRISDSVIYAQNAFYDNEAKQFRTHRFSPWSVHFASTTQSQGRSAERHLLIFDPILVHSYNSGYLKSLDTDFFFSLKNPMAKSLYQLVDAKRRGKLSWTVDVQQLRQLISMPSTYRHDSKIEEKTRPGVKELKKRGFFERVDYEQRGDSHVLCFRISREFAEARERPQISLSDAERKTVDGLMRHGVASATAEKLVSENGASHCRRYLESLAYQRNVSNPAGWLVRYIEKGWPVPLPTEVANKPLPEDSEQKPLQPASGHPSGSEMGKPVQSPDEEHVRSALERRKQAGEFDKTISDLESLASQEYRRFVDAPAPIVDAEENRFYISLSGELYIYLGPADPENRFYVCTLERPE